MEAFRCRNGHKRLLFGCPECIEVAHVKGSSRTEASTSDPQEIRHLSGAYGCPICGRPTRDDISPGKLWCSFCGNDVFTLLHITAKRLKSQLRFHVYLAWVSELTDQAILAQIAAYDKDESVRQSAMGKLTNQTLLAKVAAQSKWLDIRITAIGKVADQAFLRQLAEEDRQAAIRQASVRQIEDDRFLILRLAAEPSASVRAAIIKVLHNKDSLLEVALTAYHYHDREQAVQRLRQVTGPRWLFRWADRWRDNPPDVATAHKALAKRVKALAAETDNAKLLTLALDSEFDVLCAGAARRLRDLTALEQAAMRGRDRQVLKILLEKLEDKSILDRIAAGADDKAMRLAAAQKAGAKSWREIFNVASGKAGTVEMLGDALAALSLFQSVEPQAVDDVQHASLNLIQQGDESRIPEMVDLLEGYGDKNLTEDFLNCGQPDLNTAAVKWANRRGYPISKGAGSHRATWGSHR